MTNQELEKELLKILYRNLEATTVQVQGSKPTLTIIGEEAAVKEIIALLENELKELEQSK